MPGAATAPKPTVGASLAAPAAGPASYQVVLICPNGYAHAGAFAEVMETVVYGLRELGAEVSYAVNKLVAPGPRAILFGANLLTPGEADLLPEGTIVYNLEQIASGSTWCSPAYLSLLRRCTVWDYSRRNISALVAQGIAAPVHVPIGYMPQLSRIPDAALQDIDVLFYGSVNERRARALEALRAAGLRVHVAYGVYGSERDALVSRSKVVLNLHYYDTSIFELVRVSYLLANRKAVVAELDPRTEIDPDLAGAVRLAPYEGLVEACRQLVQDEAARRDLQETGFARMAARRTSAYLAEALGLPTRPPG